MNRSFTLICRSTLFVLGWLLGPASPGIAEDYPKDKEAPKADVQMIGNALKSKSLVAQQAALMMFIEGEVKTSDPSALGRGGDKDISKVVIGYLESYTPTAKTPELKALALRAYGRFFVTNKESASELIGATDAVKFLKPYTQNEDARVRLGAAEAVRDVFRTSVALLGTAEAPPKPKVLPVARLREQPKDAKDAAAPDEFEESVKGFAPLIQSALTDPDALVQGAGAESIRGAAIDLFEAIPRSESTDIAPLDKRKQLSTYWPNILKQFDGPAAALKTALTSPRDETKFAALRAVQGLSLVRQKVRKNQLLSATGKEDKIPPESGRELMKNGIGAVVSPVAASLRDPSSGVRLAAIEALEGYGVLAIPEVDAVTAASIDRSLFVRWVACRTLGNMVDAQVATESASKVVTALGGACADTDLDVRSAALASLALIGEPAKGAASDVQLATSRGDVELRVEALFTLLALKPDPQVLMGTYVGSIKDPDPRIRKGAAEDLGRMGPVALPAVDTLQPLLDDVDSSVRKAAANAIVNIVKGP